MSRIYFHSEHGEAELRGSERAYMGMFCGRLLVAVLEPLEDPFGRRPGPIRRLLLPDHYLLGPYAGPDRIEQLRSWLAVGLERQVQYRDQRLSVFDVALNTACAVGNDPVKLMARLHGQCEIHAWVEGPHRAWLADIMQEGRDTHLYRKDQGWEAVIALLRQTDREPVVCSYSVCEQFPNMGVAVRGGQWDAPPDPDTGESDYEPWDDLGTGEQWHFAMTALRAHDRGLELRPDHWADYYFNAGVSGLDVRAWLDEVSDVDV